MLTVKQKVVIDRGRCGKKRFIKPPPVVPESPAPPPGRVPRVSKLMALAIKFDGLLQTGVVSDQLELARLSMVTQPRMTQIMNLLGLAPDIQEELLFLPRVLTQRDPIHEKMLRPLAAELNWRRQREIWQAIFSTRSLDSAQ